MDLESGWVGHAALPGGLCALIAWIALIDRFHGKGRLLGSRQAAGLAFVVCAVMAAAAAATAFLLPKAAHLPPAAFAALGTSLTKRGRRQQEGAMPLSAVLSLGVARLLSRLEERLDDDRATWCDRMMDGMKDQWQVQIFIDGVRSHLIQRAHGNKGRLKEIEDRYAEVVGAFTRVTNVEMEIDSACEVDRRSWIPSRPRTEAESLRSRRAFGEAEHRCKLLLRLAHEYGKRTDDRALSSLKQQLAAGHGRGRVPGQRRPARLAVLRAWFTGRRGSR